MTKYKLQTASKRRASRKFNHGIFKIFRNITIFIILIILVFIISPKNLSEDVNKYSSLLNKNFNMKISEIDIKGHDELEKFYIQKIVNVNIGDNILEVDLSEIKTKLLNEPWIKSVVISRYFPNKIEVLIEEEKPYALYIENDKNFLINREGKLIKQIENNLTNHDYFTVSGKNANLDYNKFLDEIYNYHLIYNRLLGLEKINERRWNLKLKNNILIKLPQYHIKESLVFFENFLQENEINHSCSIDLRFVPNKVYIEFIN